MKVIFKDFESVAPYRDDWNMLAEIRGNALISYEWFECCANSFHNNDNLYIVCIIVNDKLIAVAPMYKSISCRHLQIMGSRRLYEPSSLLYHNDKALTALIDACADIGIPILFSRLSKNIYSQSKLKLIRARSLLLTRPSASSQFIEQCSDFESYEKSLSSRKRYDLRRAHKNALKYGSISYEINEKNIPNLDQLLHQAYEIENSCWKTRSGSSIYRNDDLNKFFSCLFVSLEKGSKCVISFLKIDNKPVATQLSIRQFNSLWLLKIGYDENYASFSPGTLLMHEMIRYAHIKKLKLFEFLGNEEAWLDSWRPATRQYNNLLLYPLSCKGITGLCVDIYNVTVNKIKRAIYK